MLFVVRMENLKTHSKSLSFIFEKRLVLFIICSKCEKEDKKLSKEQELIEILKNIGVIKNI